MLHSFFLVESCNVDRCWIFHSVVDHRPVHQGRLVQFNFEEEVEMVSDKKRVGKIERT